MNEWNSESFVRNFGQCGAEQFEKMRADLGLSLPDRVFAACASEYAGWAKRDPTIGELRLLDRLFSLRKTAAGTAFTQIDTNDPARAATYADMMEKRRALRPGIGVPLSLGEAFSLANDALTRGGKPGAQDGCPALLEPLSADRRERTVCADGGAAALRLPLPGAAFGNACEGDVFILVRRGEQTPHDFRKTMAQLSADDGFLRPLRGIGRIDDRGILPFLLPLSAGLYIDMNRMNNGRETALALLAGELEGDWIACLPKADAETFLSTLSEQGLSGAMFAAITAGAQTVLVPVSGQRLVFRTAFLRSLCSPGTVSAVLRDEIGRDPVSVAPRVNAPACRYLPDAKEPEQVVSLPGATVSASASTPAGAPFRSALAAAAAPVLALALAGVDYPTVRYAVDLALPREAPDPGNALSAVLGLYRAQAELGIPAAALRLSETDGTAPILTVFALSGPAAVPACRLKKPGAGVYFVSVPVDPDGLPDFAGLRAMLTDLARNVRPLSARVLANEAVTDALRAMRTPTLSVRLSDRAVASEGRIALGMVLESEEELPFARIGTVAERETDPEEAVAVPFAFPAGKGLIWRESPEAVVLAASGDVDAEILAARLTDLGAAVSRFTGAEAGPLSRSMLTASAVFVCPGATWPDDPRVELARQTMERDGGVLLSLGETDSLPETVPHRHFPAGILL